MPLVVSALVPPGIHDEKDKDEDAEDQKHNRPWLVFPKEMESFGDFVQIHAEQTYTRRLKSQCGGLRRTI